MTAGQAAVAGDQGREHHRVHVGDLAARAGVAGGEQLIAGDDHHDLGPADTAIVRRRTALRTPRSWGRSTRPDLEHDRPGRDVLAAASDVPAGRGRLDDPDGLALGLGRFDLHDGVGTLRDCRPGRDLDRLARPDHRLAPPPGPRLVDASEGDRRRGRGPERLLAPDGIAVHRRAVEGRHRCNGLDLRRQHAPGRQSEINRLGRERLDPARISAVTSSTLDRDRKPRIRGSRGSSISDGPLSAIGRSSTGEWRGRNTHDPAP